MDETLEVAEQRPRQTLDPEAAKWGLERLSDPSVSLDDKLSILGDWADAAPCDEARSALLEVVTREEDCELCYAGELRLAAALSLGDFLPGAFVPVVEFLGVCSFYVDEQDEDDEVLCALEEVARRGGRPMRSLDSIGLVHHVSELVLGRIPDEEEVLENEDMWKVQNVCAYLRVGAHGFFVDGPPPRTLGDLVKELDRRE